MSPAVLIAALSGRALAQSARRAGFVPLVADAFGDMDTLTAAHAVEVLPGALRRGFARRPLLGALARLAAAAPSPPEGLVLGAGFEDRPHLVAALAREHRILGCGADAVARAKSPDVLFPLLAGRGIAHPETLARPGATALGGGWLQKRIGGTGGLHIRPLAPGARIAPRHYAQRRVDGEPVSVLAIVGTSDMAFAFSRQWTAPAVGAPFRYGGASSGLVLDADLEARLIDAAVEVCRTLQLTGLVSLDVLVAADQPPVVVEINPRPGATIDIFDDQAGTLFACQVAAAQGRSLRSLLAGWAPPAAAAAAYLYADRGRLAVPQVAWPIWALDRPAPGTAVPPGRPIATATAAASGTDAAETLCRKRLSELEKLLYQC